MFYFYFSLITFLLTLLPRPGQGFVGVQPQRPVAAKTTRLSEASSSLDDATTTTTTTTTTKSATFVSNNNNYNQKNDKTHWIEDAFMTKHENSVIVGPKHAIIYDTTLRDGTQGESVSASADDKLKICRRLVSFGVDYVEAGWPGSNPKDAEFFERARTELSEFERSKLTAFGSTRRKNVPSAASDPQVQALLASEAPTVCIVAKSHSWQVTEILKAQLEENLNMIRDTVAFLTEQGRQVMVDLEHFFDGYRADPEYAMACCEAAADAGACCLVLCDTNGGTLPWTVGDISKTVVEHFDGHVTIGIHCHNDCGMAVANSLSACNNGVGLIQGTINGIGERTGNADLCSIIPALSLHMESEMTCNNHLSELTKLSRFVDEILNRSPNSAAPFVGSSAFAHKGGLHVAAMERSPLSYQHIEPEKVGNEKRILVSELSGRQNILGLMEEAGIDMSDPETKERALKILNRVKELESKGYTFEGAEASVRLMILHAAKQYCPQFLVLDYSTRVFDVNVGSSSSLFRTKDNADVCDTAAAGATTRATVKVRTMTKGNHDGMELPYEDRLEVSDGNGPVDALANALMKALKPSHPYLDSVELVDYKVRILDPQSATRAATRVMIEFRDSSKNLTWTTVAVDTNVISASFNALIDGIEYALLEHTDKDTCVVLD